MTREHNSTRIQEHKNTRTQEHKGTSDKKNTRTGTRRKHNETRHKRDYKLRTITKVITNYETQYTNDDKHE